MNDVFSAEDASAIARDITIDLSEAVAGTSLECEQGGVYQSTPWSTASVHIRRQIEGDKLTIETVFDTQLAINTGSGCQPGAYRITSRGTVFFNEPILVNNNFVQQRTECSLEGVTCYANRPACLADAFGAANDQGVIGNPHTEYERLNFFGIDPQCWEPAGFFQSCGAMADARVPENLFGSKVPHEVHCVFNDEGPSIGENSKAGQYTKAGWTRLDNHINRTYDCQACFYRELP